MENSELKEKIIIRLRNFHSYNNPLKSKEIEDSFSISGSTVRTIMNQIIDDQTQRGKNGFILCSKANGYYIAMNYKEARDGINWLSERLKSQINRLKIISEHSKEKFPEEYLREKSKESEPELFGELL